MPAAPERKYGTNATVPCHHALSKMLHAYIAAAGIADSRKGGLFRTSPDDNADVMTEQPMNQKDGWRSALALEMTELPKSWSPRGSPRSNKTREGRAFYVCWRGAQASSSGFRSWDPRQ